jgi:hypothetical protein
MEPHETETLEAFGGQARGGCFLASLAGFGRGPSGQRAVPWGLTVLMVLPACASAPTVPPFAPGGSYSGDAAIPEAASRWGETLAPPRDRTVSQCLWVRLTRRIPGRRGTFTGQCGQPLYPGEITSHLVGPQRGTVVPRCEGKRTVPLPRGFGRLGSVAYRPGRNVTPPELLLPGPSVSDRCRPLLAA